MKPRSKRFLVVFISSVIVGIIIFLFPPKVTFSGTYCGKNLAFLWLISGIADGIIFSVDEYRVWKYIMLGILSPGFLVVVFAWILIGFACVVAPALVNTFKFVWGNLRLFCKWLNSYL